MNRQILEEATAWFVDFRSGEVDGERRRAYARWLRMSPEHIRAYLDVAGTYAQLPTPAHIEPDEVERLLAKVRSRATSGESVFPFAPADMSCAKSKVNKGLQKWRIAAGFTALGIALAVGAFILTRVPVYATRIGEQLSVTLSDGSRIDLNARSKVKVKFTDDVRSVQLLEGQALFDVEADIHRPFVVRSDNTFVRALGTRFDIDRKASGTRVTVLEGKVAVSSPSLWVEKIPEYVVTAGEQAVVTASAIGRPRPANAASATAWMEHQLEFDETPLADVVEELNRHNARPMIIEADGLQDFRVTGVYSSRDPASLIRFLRNQPRITVTEAEKEVRIGEL